jgi:hypothetical protein
MPFRIIVDAACQKIRILRIVENSSVTNLRYHQKGEVSIRPPHCQLGLDGLFQAFNAAQAVKDIMPYDPTVTATGPGSFEGNVEGVAMARIA